MSEELSGKNRGILGCPPALGDKPVNGRKVQEERWKFPSQNLGTGKLITSRGTSLIWTNGHERGGGRRKGGGLLFPPETFDRVSVCCLSHCSRMFIFEDEILFQKKKRKIGFQFVIVTITRKYLSFFERYQNEPLSFRSFNNFICVFYLFLWIIIAIFCIILKKLIQF